MYRFHEKPRKFAYCETFLDILPSLSTTKGMIMHRQNDWKNIKWSLAVLALGGVLFGCAGNSVGTNATGATGGTTATTGGLFSDVASVNLPDTPASLQYVFLTGAGRAGDTKVATVRNIIATDIIGTTSSGLTPKTLTLTAYQSQMLVTNTDLASQQSRLFNSVQMNVVNFTQTDSSGTQSFNSIVNIPADIPSAIRIFRGRQIHVPIFLDPDTFITETVNVGGTDITQARFDQSWFNTINQPQGDTISVRSYLSDYMCFDVSAMNPGDLPSLSNANGPENRIFFSGDGFAIANGNPTISGAPFELILTAGQGASVVGRYSASANLGGVITPGTYTTLAVDPSDVTTTDPVLAHKITSFQGEWRYHFKQQMNPLTGKIDDIGDLSNAHPFEAISIPTSLDDERQQVVMFTENITTNGDGSKSAQVTKLMWGYLDLAKKQVFIYPLTNLTDPDATTNRTGEVAGTIGTMYTSTGATTLSPQQMRFAQFTLSGAPAGFPSSGKIVVLRR